MYSDLLSASEAMLFVDLEFLPASEAIFFIGS
jgi:hypothetical protein